MFLLYDDADKAAIFLYRYYSLLFFLFTENAPQWSIMLQIIKYYINNSSTLSTIDYRLSTTDYPLPLPSITIMQNRSEHVLFRATSASILLKSEAFPWKRIHFDIASALNRTIFNSQLLFPPTTNSHLIWNKSLSNKVSFYKSLQK